jgi:membrane protease YdiL (CAAX protease family)
MHPAYHRLARTERYRWWKPLVELLLVVVLVFLLAIAVVAPALFLTRFANDGAAGLITLGLSIAVAIPAALLAARMTGRPWRALFSVDGRLRGRWFAVCLLVAVGETLVGLIAVNTFCALGYGPDPGAWVGWSEFAPLAISVMAVIPLQAAAEEVFFRGTLMQALGAWVRPAWFAILISSLAFGLLHMLPLAGLAWVTALGLVAGWLTVRTGGLEAAIALHAVNNVSNFLLEAASGRGDRWVTEMNADVRWSSTLFGVMFFVLYGFVIARLHAEQFPPAGERAF